MRHHDTYFSKEHRYALGQDLDSGSFYASFPVAAQVIDYEEYYKLTDEQYAEFLADPVAALTFVTRCRLQQPETDVLLLQKPGWNRGIPS